MAKKKNATQSDIKKSLPKPKSKDRHPQVTEVGGPNPFGTQVQCWDDDLAKRLKEMGRRYGVDDYDPVVALAEMALQDDLDDHLKFKCHQEVAKFVRLKRQIEPVVKIEQNTYNLPPEQRRERIKELTLRLNKDGTYDG